MRQQRTSTYGGASPLATGVADYTYDQYGRMTQMKDDVTPTGGTKVTRNQFDYAYNPAHNLLKEEYTKVNGKAGDRFTYDAYHRIKDAYMGVDTTVMAGADPTSFNASTMTKQFSYDLDAAQNRTNVNETTAAGTEVTPYYLVGDGSNRYQYVGDARPEHDNRGNLTFDGRFYYRYDFLNRLQEVWKVIREGSTAQQSAIEGGEKYMVVESVEALDSSRKEVEEDVFQLMRRLPTEHANPTFRSRLRSPIPGGVIVVPNQASGTSSSTSGGGMPGFILPADLELVAVYGYDAYNRRVIRVVVDDYVGGAWVTTYDGWREAVEHTVVPSSPAQMVPVKQFVHGSDLDEILAYRRFNGTSWEDYHILHGGQDTAAKLVNQSGQVVEQYEYDPFGKATVYTAAGALVDVGPAGTSPEDGTRSAYGLTHLYKAMRLDPETGNCYVRNRFYDPRTGRFMSRDPIGVWGDAGNMGNEYAYAWNRPLVVGDPLGLQSGLAIREMIAKGVLPPVGWAGDGAEDGKTSLRDVLARGGTKDSRALGDKRVSIDEGESVCPRLETVFEWRSRLEWGEYNLIPQGISRRSGDASDRSYGGHPTGSDEDWTRQMRWDLCQQQILPQPGADGLFGFELLDRELKRQLRRQASDLDRRFSDPSILGWDEIYDMAPFDKVLGPKGFSLRPGLGGASSLLRGLGDGLQSGDLDKLNLKLELVITF